MRNPIAIQDEYIKRTVKLDPKGINYCVNVSKAWKAAKNALLDYGLSENYTQFLLEEAHGLMQLERFFNQKSRVAK
jgi:hypothetical protein